jgi:hypothetical protein
MASNIASARLGASRCGQSGIHQQSPRARVSEDAVERVRERVEAVYRSGILIPEEISRASPAPLPEALEKRRRRARHPKAERVVNPHRLEEKR